MENLKPGLSITMEKIVQADETASKYGSGLVEVLATPALVAFLEKASLKAVLPYLDKGNNTVGTSINIKHLKATAVGKKIWCKSTLKSVEGKKLFFDVEAWDEEGKIGTGEHGRCIINTEEFMKKLSK